MPISTRLTARLGITHPVISAPMALAAGGRLAAAVSNAGGLGLIGSADPGGLVASFLIPGLLLIPAYAWLALRRFDGMDAMPDLGDALPIEAVGYVIGWTAFPLAAHFLCGRWGKAKEWYDYVAAYNMQTFETV